MNKSYHRDRIKELQNRSSNTKWILTITLTMLFGFFGLLYLVWYNQSEIYIKIFISLIVIYLLRKIGPSIKKNAKILKITHKRITRNFDILLNRKK